MLVVGPEMQHKGTVSQTFRFYQGNGMEATLSLIDIWKVTNMKKMYNYYRTLCLIGEVIKKLGY